MCKIYGTPVHYKPSELDLDVLGMRNLCSPFWLLGGHGRYLWPVGGVAKSPHAHHLREARLGPSPVPNIWK
jgi:hypothetical protein